MFYVETTEPEADDRFARELAAAYRGGRAEDYARTLSNRLRYMDKRARAANRRADMLEVAVASAREQNAWLMGCLAIAPEAPEHERSVVAKAVFFADFHPSDHTEKVWNDEAFRRGRDKAFATADRVLAALHSLKPESQ